MPSDQQLSAPSLTGVQVELLWARHKRKIIWGAIVLCLVLIGAGAYIGYQTVRNSRAGKAFVSAHDIKGWQSVMRRYPGTIAAGNAGLRAAAIQADSGQFEASDKSYRSFLHDYPNHPLYVSGLFGLATNAEAEGKTDEAVHYYSEISNRFSSSYLAPMALYNQGLIAESRGNLKEALQDFEDTVQRYPQSVVAQDATRDAGRLTAKLGLNTPVQQSSPTVSQAKGQASVTPTPAVNPKPSLEP